MVYLHHEQAKRAARRVVLILEYLALFSICACIAVYVGEAFKTGALSPVEQSSFSIGWTIVTIILSTTCTICQRIIEREIEPNL